MKVTHLRLTVVAKSAYCGVAPVLVDRGSRTGTFDPPVTTFATEATCVRCLRLAVVHFEKAYMVAKYYDANNEAKP